jgi:hypothetical protein
MQADILSRIVVRNPTLFFYSTSIGTVGNIGVSAYRLLVDDKHDDLYAPIVIGLSALFNFVAYSFLLSSLMVRSKIVFKILLIILLLFNPLIISAGILVLKRSDLANKESIAKLMWSMNIVAQLVYGLIGVFVIGLILKHKRRYA